MPDTISSIRSAVGSLTRTLTGEDIFVSYCRSDASDYALALATQLTDRGFTTYIDQWETEPGVKVPPRILRKIKWSAMFVLIVTPNAMVSESIQDEVTTFVTTGRAIVPIHLDGQIESAIWWPTIQGLAIAQEPPKEAVSAEVLTRIENSFRYGKKNTKLRRATLAVGLLFVGFLGAAVLARREAKVQQKAAHHAELMRQ